MGDTDFDTDTDTATDTVTVTVTDTVTVPRHGPGFREDHGRSLLLDRAERVR